MSGIDPQKLIYRLYEVTEKIKRCTHVQRDTLKNASYTQDCASERVNQSKHHAGVVMTQVDNDLQNVEEEKIKVINQLKKCTQATEISRATLREGESALQTATDTLNHWNGELQKALAWLKQAEIRLEQAIQEYRAAQNDLQRAKNNLERTEANLRRCINDSERKNCDREASNYDGAKREALISLANLETAEEELRLAQEEVARANARVNCCNKAVEYAQQAADLAKQAVDYANEALNSAERSLEEVESAERHLIAAEDKVNHGLEIASEMMQKVIQGETLASEAFSVYLIADKEAEYAQRLASNGCQEIRSRQEELYRFNQQEPLFSIPGTGEIVYAQPLSNQDSTLSRINSINGNTQTPNISEFAKNLDYQVSQELEKSIRIKAINPNNREILGEIIAKPTNDNKVKIKDTNVSDKYQGQNNADTKGIGTMLLQSLENQFPDGTELYFSENLAEGFWKKMGFQESEDSNGKKYSKIISHHKKNE